MIEEEVGEMTEVIVTEEDHQGPDHLPEVVEEEMTTDHQEELVGTVIVREIEEVEDMLTQDQDPMKVVMTQEREEAVAAEVMAEEEGEPEMQATHLKMIEEIEVPHTHQELK